MDIKFVELSFLQNAEARPPIAQRTRLQLAKPGAARKIGRSARPVRPGEAG